METSTDKIKKQIVHVINKTIFKEKKKIFNFRGTALYPSEVHLLLVIKNDIDTNATAIAKQLGLTKGAVSQTLVRLEKKGIILKTKDPYNKNELTLSLTKFGEKAYELCQSRQAAFIEAHEGYLAALGPQEKEVILNFLLHMEQAIDDLEKNLEPVDRAGMVAGYTAGGLLTAAGVILLIFNNTQKKKHAAQYRPTLGGITVSF